MDVYPLTVIKDRYNGVYSGASYLAFNLDFYLIPPDVDGDDPTCANFWLNYEGIVGKGSTANEAFSDLGIKLEEKRKCQN